MIHFNRQKNKLLLMCMMHQIIIRYLIFNGAEMVLLPAKVWLKN